MMQKRHRQLMGFSQPVRYLWSGGITVLVDGGGYLILKIIFPTSISATLSFIIAVAVNYVLQSRFVFAKDSYPDSAKRYAAAVTAGLLYNYALVAVADYAWGEADWGKVVAIASWVPISFLLAKLWVFRRPVRNRS